MEMEIIETVDEMSKLDRINYLNEINNGYKIIDELPLIEELILIEDSCKKILIVPKSYEKRFGNEENYFYNMTSYHNDKVINIINDKFPDIKYIRVLTPEDLYTWTTYSRVGDQFNRCKISNYGIAPICFDSDTGEAYEKPYKKLYMWPS